MPWTLLVRERSTGRTVFGAESVVPRMATHQLLSQGEYDWTVAYRTRHGKTVTSAARRFAVDTESSPVIFPTGRAFAAAVVARPHPRILPTNQRFDDIARKASESPWHAAALHALIVQADKALKIPIPTPDAGVFGGGRVASYAGRIDQAALRSLVDQERVLIEALSLAGNLTGEEQYRAHAVERLLRLAEWSPDGPTSEANFDYANREIYRGLAQGLDALWDTLSDAQRRRVAGQLKSRLAQAIARFSVLARNPYDSHVDVIAWSVLESLMYAADSSAFAEAQSWLADTWEHLLTTANTWGAEDGGFGNGVAYGWYRMAHIARVLAAIRVMSGVDFVKHPWLSRFGDYLIAMTAPNATHHSAFGDGLEVTNLYSSYAPDEFRLYAALTGSAHHLWYAHAAPAARPGRYFEPWHLMLLGLGIDGNAAGAPPSRHAWFFGDAGVTAMHSDTAAADRSSLYFRSSEFGSWSHSHADQNAFTFVSHGIDLLVSGGYYPYFLSPHHAAVTRATRYKNALTFDGGIGQAEISAKAPGPPVQSRDARGEIVNFLERGNWMAVTGDATMAYRTYEAATRRWTPLLSNAVRSVAYDRKERVVIVYDWATSVQPRRWELNFNALARFSGGGRAARVANGGATACIDIHGPAGAFSFASAFHIPPERAAPDQHRATFSSDSKSGSLVAVAVIREDCRAVPVSVDIRGDSAMVSIDGGTTLIFQQGYITLPE